MNKKHKILYSIIAIVGAVLLAVPSFLTPFKADTSLSTIDKDKKGSITIHKYEQAGEVDGTLDHDGTEVNMPSDAKPLKDVEFSIYYLGDNIGTSSYIKTVDAAEEYIANNNVSAVSVTTGEDGIAKFSNLQLGQYLVKETKSPENVSEVTPPFIVNVPTTVTVDGVDKWLYDIHVYPKNQTIYGSVILNKTDEAGNPLAGAEFSLYAKGKDGADDVLRAEHLTTNEHGQLVVENLPKGDYYFVETKAPDGYGINPTPLEFTITASGTVKIDDTTGLYVKTDDLQTVVELTFVNNKEPNIHKGVKSVTNQYSGYDFGEGHEWVISPDIPADIDKYTKYVVTDTIDENLIFSGLDTVKVYTDGTWTDDSDGTVGTYSGGTLLIPDVDYKVTFENGKLTVIFIDDTFKSSALTGKNNLYIFFETTFDETKVSLGTDYPNKAELTYNNSFMTDDATKESETPKVHAGGLSLLKYTMEGNSVKPLEGAEFRLATSEQNAKEGIFIQKDRVDIIGRSDSNGIVKFEGIAYGKDGDSAEDGSTTYWLVETKAPEVDGVKYNLLDSPKEVVINATSHIIPDDTTSLSDWTITIINNSGIKLPTTGGIGTLLFYLVGAILMGSAIVMFVKSNKKTS